MRIVTGDEMFNLVCTLVWSGDPNESKSGHLVIYIYLPSPYFDIGLALGLDAVCFFFKAKNDNING